MYLYHPDPKILISPLHRVIIILNHKVTYYLNNFLWERENKKKGCCYITLAIFLFITCLHDLCSWVESVIYLLCSFLSSLPLFLSMNIMIFVNVRIFMRHVLTAIVRMEFINTFSQRYWFSEF